MAKNNWELFLVLSKLNAKMTRKMDGSLWWIWWNDFMVLYYLDTSINKKMRRIDLADKIGLTASWVTRLLLPMEKVWMVKKEVNKNDARVSLVSITKWWKKYLDEAIINLNMMTEDIVDEDVEKDVKKIKKTLKLLYKNL